MSTGAQTPDPAALIGRLERVPFSKWHVQARIIVGSATLLDAFDALSLAFALPVLIARWHLTATETGLLIGAGYLGQLVGALLLGAAAERYGRVPSMTMAVTLMSVMGLACGLSESYSVLLVCRVVQGIGIGGEMPVAAAYISELSRAHGRGRSFLLYEMIFPVGLMLTGQVAAWVVPVYGWQVLFFAGAVPGLLVAASLARLPESPRWLIGRGRLREADAVIRTAERAASQHVVEAVVPATAPIATTAATGKALWQEVVGPSYRRRTVVVWCLWATAYFITNGLNNWMPSLYRTVYGLPLAEALRAASLTNVAQVLVLVVCAFTIDRIGRRLWATTAFALGGTALAVLALLGARDIAQVMVLTTLGYACIGSVNTVLYLYTPEIYPTRMRALATGLATSWLRLASAIGPPLVGVMVGATGVVSVFLMFAACSAAGLIAATRMIETRGRRLEDLAA
ncbi:MAG: MFS transporter [Vicinamibacterales bacterium]